MDDITFFESEYGYHMLENDQISDIGYGAVDDSYTPPLNTVSKVDQWQQTPADNQSKRM